MYIIIVIVVLQDIIERHGTNPYEFQTDLARPMAANTSQCKQRFKRQ